MSDDALKQAVPLDFSRLDEITDGDMEFERELWRTFEEGCRERVEALEKAMRENDADQVRRQAHAMRGASANIGAYPLEDYSKTLEAESTAGNTSHWPELGNAIRLEIEKVLEYYRENRLV